MTKAETNKLALTKPGLRPTQNLQTELQTYPAMVQLAFLRGDSSVAHFSWFPTHVT